MRAILKTPLMLRGHFGNVSGKWNQSLFQSHVREDLAFDEADYPNSAVLLQRRPGVLAPIDQDGEVVWVCTKDHTHILDAASGMA